MTYWIFTESIVRWLIRSYLSKSWLLFGDFNLSIRYYCLVLDAKDSNSNMGVGDSFPHYQANFRRHWVSYSSTQFWHYWRKHQTPQVKGWVPQDCPSLEMPFTGSSASVPVPLPDWVKSEVPMTLSLDFLICSSSSKNSGNLFMH